MKNLFIFPGQGSQKVGMGKDLVENFKTVRETFEEAADALNFDMKKICFEGPEFELQKTFNAQPALLTVSIAILRVLEKESDLKPSIVAGHSLGEYSALVAGGAFSFSEALRLVRARGQYMQEATPLGVGAMAAILGLDAQSVEEHCSQISRKNHIVACANFNAPTQIVISGHEAAVNEAGDVCKKEGARVIPLPVSAPFHCELMKSAEEKMKEALEMVRIQKLNTPYVANYDAQLREDSSEIKDLLISQICHSVRWVDSMKTALKYGVEQGFEVGYGSVLKGLMKKIDGQFPVKTLSTVEELKEVLS